MLPNLLEERSQKLIIDSEIFDSEEHYFDVGYEKLFKFAFLSSNYRHLTYFLRSLSLIDRPFKFQPGSLEGYSLIKNYSKGLDFFIENLFKCSINTIFFGFLIEEKYRRRYDESLLISLKNLFSELKKKDRSFEWKINIKLFDIAYNKNKFVPLDFFTKVSETYNINLQEEEEKKQLLIRQAIINIQNSSFNQSLSLLLEASGIPSKYFSRKDIWLFELLFSVIILSGAHEKIRIGQFSSLDFNLEIKCLKFLRNCLYRKSLSSLYFIFCIKRATFFSNHIQGLFYNIFQFNVKKRLTNFLKIYHRIKTDNLCKMTGLPKKFVLFSWTDKEKFTFLNHNVELFEKYMVKKKKTKPIKIPKIYLKVCMDICFLLHRSQKYLFSSFLSVQKQNNNFHS